MRRNSARLSIPSPGLGLGLGLLGVLLVPCFALAQGGRMTVTVGPADADVIGTDNGAIQKAVDAGKLQSSAVIDVAALVAAGLVRRARDGVRVLANGEITTGVKLEVAGASKAAIAAIEKAGGSVKIVGAAEEPTP